MDYANFLIKRFIVTQFSNGSNEVHVVFDNPGCIKNTPKYFEQSRRDQAVKIAEDHHCDDLVQQPRSLEDGVRGYYTAVHANVAL